MESETGRPQWQVAIDSVHVHIRKGWQTAVHALHTLTHALANFFFSSQFSFQNLSLTTFHKPCPQKCSISPTATVKNCTRDMADGHGYGLGLGGGDVTSTDVFFVFVFFRFVKVLKKNLYYLGCVCSNKCLICSQMSRGSLEFYWGNSLTVCKIWLFVHFCCVCNL